MKAGPAAKKAGPAAKKVTAKKTPAKAAASKPKPDPASKAVPASAKEPAKKAAAAKKSPAKKKPAAGQTAAPAGFDSTRIDGGSVPDLNKAVNHVIASLKKTTSRPTKQAKLLSTVNRCSGRPGTSSC